MVDGLPVATPHAPGGLLYENDTDPHVHFLFEIPENFDFRSGDFYTIHGRNYFHEQSEPAR